MEKDNNFLDKNKLKEVIVAKFFFKSSALNKETMEKSRDMLLEHSTPLSLFFLILLNIWRGVFFLLVYMLILG